MPKTPTVHHKKRHGLHHKRSSRYMKAYLPYMPVVVAMALSLLVGGFKPAAKGTLAYATEMSAANLLTSTNTQRANNGSEALRLNQQLSAAAQAKANDMVARNYWAHNTPDGQEPWIFIKDAGYQYLKAGENLAYGFNTSNDAVVGWMNSTTHRENMLDSAFSEVGFGFANGNNFNKAGPETVVVAMYGKPRVLGAAAGQTQPASPATSTPLATPQQPVNSAVVVHATSQSITKPITSAQALTGGQTPWVVFIVGLVSGGAIIFLMLKHALAVRHVLVRSEKMVLRHIHHPWLDSIALSLIILGVTLSRTVGFIA